jgi:hypothetical protein
MSIRFAGTSCQANIFSSFLFSVPIQSLLVWIKIVDPDLASNPIRMSVVLKCLVFICKRFPILECHGLFLQFFMRFYCFLMKKENLNGTAVHKGSRSYRSKS